MADWRLDAEDEAALCWGDDAAGAAASTPRGCTLSGPRGGGARSGSLLDEFDAPPSGAGAVRGGLALCDAPASPRAGGLGSRGGAVCVLRDSGGGVGGGVGSSGRLGGGGGVGSGRLVVGGVGVGDIGGSCDGSFGGDVVGGLGDVECAAGDDGATDGVDFAEDLDFIGKSLGLGLDEESRLLGAPAGRREWIRKEMMRREGEFTKVSGLRVRVGTWNVNGRAPRVPLSKWLLPGGDAPDVFVLSFQEVQPLSGMSAVATDAARGMAWKAAVEEALCCPREYVTVAARQMVGILLVALVKACHEPFVRDVMMSDAGTGFMRSGGNKGGVACRLALYDKTLSCVSCHFAAHENMVDRRNQDFHDVVRKLAFSREPGVAKDPSPFSYLEYDEMTLPPREPPPDKDVTAGAIASPTGAALASSIRFLSGEGGERLFGQTDPRAVRSQPDGGARFGEVLPVGYSRVPKEPIGVLDHDVVLWAGDLNYRIQLTPDDAMRLIERRDWPQLGKYDQLQNARLSGAVFQGFEEGELNFAPTYKVERERDRYQMKDVEGEEKVARTPSWTDRILWRDRVRWSSRQLAAGDVRGAAVVPGGNGKPLKDVGLKLEHYGRYEVLSSDHRPVSADFLLDCRLIDIKRRNEVVRKIHAQLARREQALRSFLSVSSTTVDLGRVCYDEAACNTEVPFSVRNEGRVTAFVSVCIPETHPWLTVDGHGSRVDKELAPGASWDIVFRAHVAPHSLVARELSMRHRELAAVANIVIDEDSMFSLMVLGSYESTCRGVTLGELACLEEPIGLLRGVRALHSSASTDVSASDWTDDEKRGYLSEDEGAPRGEMVTHVSSVPFLQARALTIPSRYEKPASSGSSHPTSPIPREVWVLVDFLMQQAVPLRRDGKEGMTNGSGSRTLNLDPGVFLERSDEQSVRKVLRCLDVGAPIPEGSSQKLVGSCLLAVLEALNEPIVPLDAQSACLKVGRRVVGSCTAKELLTALTDIPPVNLNTVMYLAALLAEMPGARVTRRASDPSHSVAKRLGWAAAAADREEYPSAAVLARAFVPAFFGAAHDVGDPSCAYSEDDSNEEWSMSQAHTSFICHLIEGARSGLVSATFDL